MASSNHAGRKDEQTLWINSTIVRFFFRDVIDNQEKLQIQQAKKTSVGMTTQMKHGLLTMANSLLVN